MSDTHGYVDIEWDQVEKMAGAVVEKEDVCKILPAGRFYLTSKGLTYMGLVCSKKMGGKQTGVGAEYCNNCLVREVDHVDLESVDLTADGLAIRGTVPPDAVRVIQKADEPTTNGTVYTEEALKKAAEAEEG